MLNTVLSILHILLHLISTTTLWSNSNRIFIKSLFLIERWLLYYVVLVSVVQQHASALSTYTHTHTHTHTYISPASWASSSTPISPLSGITEHQAELPVLHSSFPLAILHMVVYIFQCCSSISPTLSLPRWVHKSILYVCVSIPALQIGSSIPFF